MRAAIFEGACRARVREAPLPVPGSGQVRIRLQGSGVCGSNLPVWEGRPWFTYPMAPGQPGHEGWGVVEATGRDVESLNVGDRVACLTQAAYAEYDLAAATDVVPLPRSIAAEGCPGEPLACAINVMRRSHVDAGTPVVIVGIGFLGALLVQLAAARGAHVVAVSRRPYALDLARQCGAAGTVTLGDTETTVEGVRRLLGAQGAPCVIEAVGSQQALDVAAGLVAVRGQLVIAGYHQDGRRQVDLQGWNWRGIDVVNAHERDPRAYVDGLRLAIEALATGALALTPLITTRVPLDALDEAFTLMRDRPDGFLKAVVRCD